MKLMKSLIVGFSLCVAGAFPANADSLAHDVFIFCDGDAQTMTVELALAWHPTVPNPTTKSGEQSLTGKANLSGSWRLQNPANPRRTVALKQTQISDFFCDVPVSPDNASAPSQWLRARAEIWEEPGNANPNGRCGAAEHVWARLTWLGEADNEGLHTINRQLINTCDFGFENLPIRKIIMDVTNGGITQEDWLADEMP